MKYLKIWTAVALLIAGCAVSFMCGREYESYYYNYDGLFEVHQKTRNEASRMAQLIQCYEMHLEEDSIQDWNCFEDLEGIFLYDDALGDPIDLSNYK